MVKARAMAPRLSDPPALEERMHPAARVFLGLVGGAVPFLVLRELGPSIWPPNIGSPISATITLGALTVAGIYVAAALFGPTKRWTAEPHALRIEFKVGPWAQRRRFTSGDIARLWAAPTGDADSFPRACVCFNDQRGKTWRSPVFRTDTEAQVYAQQLARHLRIAVSNAP